MTTLDKIIATRKQQGLSKARLADLMNYSRSNISRVESGERKLTPDYITQFKEALDAPNLPLNKEDERNFLDKLHNWREAVFRYDVSVANDTYPAIARVASLTLDSDLRILCQLFMLSYYRITNAMDKYDTLFNELEAQVDVFNNEHNIGSIAKAAPDIFMRVDTVLHWMRISSLLNA